MRCKNCNAPDMGDPTGMVCWVCGEGECVGPTPDEDPLGPSAEQAVAEPDVPGDDAVLIECPQCHAEQFDGWNCRACGFAISRKAKRAHGKILSPAEADEVRRRLGFME